MCIKCIGIYMYFLLLLYYYVSFFVEERSLIVSLTVNLSDLLEKVTKSTTAVWSYQLKLHWERFVSFVL